MKKLLILTLVIIPISVAWARIDLIEAGTKECFHNVKNIVVYVHHYNYGGDERFGWSNNIINSRESVLKYETINAKVHDAFLKAMAPFTEMRNIGVKNLKIDNIDLHAIDFSDTLLVTFGIAMQQVKEKEGFDLIGAVTPSLKTKACKNQREFSLTQASESFYIEDLRDEQAPALELALNVLMKRLFKHLYKVDLFKIEMEKK